MVILGGEGRKVGSGGCVDGCIGFNFKDVVTMKPLREDATVHVEVYKLRTQQCHAA